MQSLKNFLKKDLELTRSRWSKAIGVLRGSPRLLKIWNDTVLRERRNDDESGKNERKCAAQHGVSPCEAAV